MATKKTEGTGTSSMYRQFKTDDKIEQQGVTIDYGEFRILIARAGGSNRRYTTLLNAKTKPYRRAIQTDNMDDKLQLKILQKVFAASVVLNWETMVDGEWKKGIEAEDGSLMTVNKENIVQTFTNLPDLFLDIQIQAQNVALFKHTINEEDAKN